MMTISPPNPARTDLKAMFGTAIYARVPWADGQQQRMTA